MDKEEFWAACILVDGGHRRLVAKMDFEAQRERNKDGKGKYEDRVPIPYERMWVPESVDEDFNLVLSLTTAGLHAPLADCDTGNLSLAPDGGEILCRRHGELKVINTVNGRPWTLVQSTTNWHAYNPALVCGGMGDPSELYWVDGFTDWYQASVIRQIWALRPPWIKKAPEPEPKPLEGLKDFVLKKSIKDYTDEEIKEMF